MNLKFVKLSAMLLALVMVISCESKDENLSEEYKELKVLSQQAFECKLGLKSTKSDQKIKLKAEDGNRLRLSYSNAKINCAGLDTTHAVLNNGMLSVSFIENPMADCICVRDLECVIDAMEQRKYDIKVYVNGEEPKAVFSFVYSSELDLTYEVDEK